MADNINQNNGSSDKDMNPSKDLYKSLMEEIYKYKLEEREMALDRYRRADEQMDTAESFILMGKNAIAFLKQASESSDSLAGMAKEIKSIVYKDDAEAGGATSMNDADRRAIIDALSAEEEAKKSADEAKEMKDEDLTDGDSDYED